MKSNTSIALHRNPAWATCGNFRNFISHFYLNRAPCASTWSSDHRTKSHVYKSLRSQTKATISLCKTSQITQPSQNVETTLKSRMIQHFCKNMDGEEIHDFSWQHRLVLAELCSPPSCLEYFMELAILLWFLFYPCISDFWDWLPFKMEF